MSKVTAGWTVTLMQEAVLLIFLTRPTQILLLPFTDIKSICMDPTASYFRRPNNLYLSFDCFQKTAAAFARCSAALTSAHSIGCSTACMMHNCHLARLASFSSDPSMHHCVTPLALTYEKS